jgi:hypothetical protein
MIPALLFSILLVPASADQDDLSSAFGDAINRARASAAAAAANNVAPPPSAAAPSGPTASPASAAQGASHSLVLSCGEDGDLRSFTIDGRSPAQGGGTGDGEHVLLRDSSSGSLDANRTGSYSAAEFARIAADAVKWGVDPYLALAMDVHENSAKSSVGRSGVADNDDLDWIIHPIRIDNTLNCTTQSPSGAYVNTTTLTLDLDPTRSLGGASTTVTACLPDFKNPHAQALYNINVPGSPDNALRFASDAGGGVGDACCANLRMPQKLAEAANASGAKTMLSLFKSAVAMRTLRLMQDAAAEHGAVYAVQGWNGHGEVRTSYQSIYNRMDMKKCPLYGDDVLDVMVNMIMNNPAAVNVVQEAAVENGDRPVKNIFCIPKASSESTVRIDSSQFLAAEKADIADSRCRDSK